MLNSTDADTETLFDNQEEGSTGNGFRGRLPGRLSSSSFGMSLEPIRSVNNLFPRPDLSTVAPTSGHATN